MKVVTVFTGIANTHIVLDKEKVIVVDAGMPHQAGRIVNQIRALGRSSQDVRLIAVTHGHVDHAGSAAALRRLTGAPIAMHRADAPLTATRGLKIPPGRNRGIDAAGRLLAHFGWTVPLEPFAPDVLWEDGMTLRDYGFDAQIVHTPGHTEGSVTLAFADGTLFVGDALLNLLHVSFPLWWQDPAAAKASACRIRSLQPQVCYTGHGRAFGARALEEFVQNHCES